MNILVGISTFANDLAAPIWGAERQGLGISRELAKRGHSVDYTNVLRGCPNWGRDFDVVYLINGGGHKGPLSLTCFIARDMGIPVFASTIFSPVMKVEKEIAEAMGFEGRTRISHELTFRSVLEDSANFYSMVDWFLPNAETEMQDVIKFMAGRGCDISAVPYTVVPNAVDVEGEIIPTLGNVVELPEELDATLKDRYILCAARVEPWKNQHRLVLAMKELWEEDHELQLVLMGNRGDHRYLNMMQDDVMGQNVLFIDPQPPLMVLQLMRDCQCHILPSLSEVPGLSSLEAAALNKPVVVTPRGSVPWYFKDYPGAFYCDPLDPHDIARALREAIAMKEAKELGEIVRRDYSYARAAEIAEGAFQSAIGG